MSLYQLVLSLLGYPTAPTTPLLKQAPNSPPMAAFLNDPAYKAFKPTEASIPPYLVDYRMKQSAKLPVNFQPLSPLNFILRAAVTHPDKLALVHPESETPVYYTYAVWAQRIQNLAYALIQAGVKPGDRVAIISPNSPMIADAHFGVLAAGAVLTLVNTRIKQADVDYILEHSGSSFIIVDHEVKDLVANSTIPTIVSGDTGRDGMGDAYEEFLNSGRRFSEEKGWAGLEAASDELAACTLSYTSGTSGRPKGVITTLRSNYLGAIGHATESHIDGDSVYLWILPMFHAAGWNYPWANVFGLGAQLILRTVSIPLIWKHIHQSKVTLYCGAPTVQIGLVNHADAKPVQHKLTTVIAGAAPTAQLFSDLEKLNITSKHVYGLTETSGPFTIGYPQPSWDTLPAVDRSKLMARQGHSFATAQEVRVVYPPGENDGEDFELVDVPKDGKTVGEIVTRGNIMMREYHNDPIATKKAFHAGVFWSGDLATMHPDGAVAIMDRSKDIIISGGENASSVAIETELASHPHVQEVAVVARAHSKWGERPHAFVMLQDKHALVWEGNHAGFAKDLKTHAKARLPGFACPEWVEIVKELPKTSTGKILKVELRKVVALLPPV